MAELLAHLFHMLLSAALGVIGMVYEPASEKEREAPEAMERAQETLESARATVGSELLSVAAEALPARQ